MLTEQDIQKLKEILATKEDVAVIRADVKDMKSDIKIILADLANHDIKFEELTEAISKIPSASYLRDKNKNTQ